MYFIYMETMNNSNNALFARSENAFAGGSDTPNGTIIMYTVLLLVVAVISAHYAGFNIFGALGGLTDSIGEYTFPIWEKALKTLGYEVEETAKDNIATTAEGTKDLGEVIVKGSEDVENAVKADPNKKTSEENDKTKNVEPSKASDNSSTNKKSAGKTSSTDTAATLEESVQNDGSTTTEVSEETSVKKKLQDGNTIVEKKVTKNIQQAMNNEQPTQTELRALSNDDYKPNDIFSESTKSNPASHKSGWCYIGNYSGYRSCSRVGEADTCMSGDIFPSHDICVNPSLRA